MCLRGAFTYLGIVSSAVKLDRDSVRIFQHSSDGEGDERRSEKRDAGGSTVYPTIFDQAPLDNVGRPRWLDMRPTT